MLDIKKLCGKPDEGTPEYTLRDDLQMLVLLEKEIDFVKKSILAQSLTHGIEVVHKGNTFWFHKNFEQLGTLTIEDPMEWYRNAKGEKND